VLFFLDTPETTEQNTKNGLLADAQRAFSGLVPEPHPVDQNLIVNDSRVFTNPLPVTFPVTADAARWPSKPTSIFLT
jgi:hypothetical protein